MNVIKIAMLVFAGGAVGATLREFLMLMVPQGSRGFPMDILAANLAAAYVLISLATGYIAVMVGLRLGKQP